MICKNLYLQIKFIDMKLIKSTFLLVALFSFFIKTNAQSSENPWAIAVGADLINLQGDNVDTGVNFGAPALSLSATLVLDFLLVAKLH